jgi:hypothetical protein
LVGTRQRSSGRPPSSAPSGPRVADELVDLGVSLFVIEYTRPPYDFSDLFTWLRWRDDRNGEA